VHDPLLLLRELYAFQETFESKYTRKMNNDELLTFTVAEKLLLSAASKHCHAQRQDTDAVRPDRVRNRPREGRPADLETQTTPDS
jgi:hypothetical protein